MANDINKCCFTGRLTRDPEVRFTSNGTRVTNFGLAVNRSWKGNDDQWREKVVFLEIQAWNGNGESLAGKCVKGDQIYVETQYELREWNDSEGNKRTSPQFTLWNWWKPASLKTAEKPDPAESEEEKPEPTKKRGRPSKKEAGTPAPTPEPSSSVDKDEDDIPF